MAFLPAHERSGREYVVKRCYHLDIRVEIYAAVAVKDVESGIVADKSPFTPLGGLTGVRDGVDIVIALIPTLNLAIG